MATSPWRRKPVRLGSGPSSWEHEILLGLSRGSGVSRWVCLFLDHGHGRVFQPRAPLHRQQPDVCQRPAGDSGDGGRGWTFVVLQQGHRRDASRASHPCCRRENGALPAMVPAAVPAVAGDSRPVRGIGCPGGGWCRRTDRNCLEGGAERRSDRPALRSGRLSSRAGRDPACGSDPLRQIVRAGCASHTSRVAGRPPRGAAHGRPGARARGRGPRGQRELAGRFTHSGSQG
jgi:hypothetical protein